MNGTRHREVGEYLRELQRAMGDLPAQRRDEILAEIEEHIDAGLEEVPPPPTDADVRNVLERVGDPADIAADARERFGIKPASKNWTDTAAIILLLLGGFVVFGWLVGVILLWISDVWRTRDKIIGTLFVPGGLAGSLFFVFIAISIPTYSCGTSGRTGGPTVSSCPEPNPVAIGVALAIYGVVLIAPIATAIYLGMRLRRARLASEV